MTFRDVTDSAHPRMTYTPQQGEIVLQYSTSNNLASRLIRYRSGSKWSHVDVVTPENDLIGARGFKITTADGLQTYPPGVQRRCNDYTDFTHALRIRIRSRDYASQYYDWIYQQIGKPYDWTAIWGFILDREWREDDSWYCDELILTGFEQIGFWWHPLSVPSWRIDPGDSQLVLSTSVSYMKIEGY